MGKGEGGRVRWTMITRKLMMVIATTTLTALMATRFSSIQSRSTNRRIMTMTIITTKATTTKTTTQ